MLVEKLLVTVFPLFVVVAIGAFYGRWKSTDISVANRMNMDVFVPALVFAVLADKSFDLVAYQDLALAAGVVVLGSGLVLFPLVKLLGWDPKTFLPPMMFNNTGNMGIPLIVLAFGEAALPAAVMVFIVEMLLHFSIGLYILDHKTKFSALLKMPVVQATILGFIFSFMGWTLPEPIAIPMEMLGQISIPLMLFTLGVRLLSVDLSDWRIGLTGAILCPLSGLLMAWLSGMIWEFDAQQWAILLVFSALPPAVLNYMVAEQYAQEPARVASIVLLGNFASVLTLPLVLSFVL
ncbi:AEC family transporter [Oceanospirillum beijerinckii]|uniref:AEC family transporter n=1 Tax=Oceanospirillum beijerinckii TaxID=64976 RepID=UPI0003FD2C4E|nr:AEC family transporter [Oceanospirillum beijerinckii]MAC45360.1 AEC family transporter [Oceanospirillum sp.]